MTLQAPFPYFGGKSRAAGEIWRRLGDVDHYIEPFCGSAAVLLARPGGPGRFETVNDASGYIANFWRAVAAEPLEVARRADWPTNENDLHARHAWLTARRESLAERLEGDPDYFDPKIAGWWCWGMACWIGGGFCSGTGPWRVVDGRLVRTGPDGRGVQRQLPHLADGGQGVQRQLPHLADGGRGVKRQLPHLADGGRGVKRKAPAGARREWLEEWMSALSARLERVRVICGDWRRAVGPGAVNHLGRSVGIYFDPPYSLDLREACYTEEDATAAQDVAAWCRANEGDPRLRLALSGYEGEHEMPGWDVYAWTARGGYGGQGKNGNGRGSKNRHLERVWFSPSCSGSEAPGGPSQGEFSFARG